MITKEQQIGILKKRLLGGNKMTRTTNEAIKEASLSTVSTLLLAVGAGVLGTGEYVMGLGMIAAGVVIYLVKYYTQDI